MRIAIVHAFPGAAVPGGENGVVPAQLDALRADGHDVHLVARHGDERARRRSRRLGAATTTVTGIGRDPSAELARIAPDVVHVHDLFPHVGTRWLARWPGPLVATLHDFRPMCAAGTLVRDGARCTACVDRSPMSAVTHGCVGSSRTAGAPLATAQLLRGATGHPVVGRADRLVAISARAVAEYGRAGVPAGRFDVVPNFVPDPPPPPRHARPDPEEPQRWLVVGRLSRETGVHELLDAWPAGRHLDVVGDGECAAELRERAGPGVRFLGHRPNSDVRRLLPQYTGLIVPGRGPEAGPPPTYLEALAAGVPTVAFDGNGAADDVALRGTGVTVAHVPGRAELAVALDGVRDRRATLATVCRAVFAERYSAATWVRAITRVYRTAVAGRQVLRPGVVLDVPTAARAGRR